MERKAPYHASGEWGRGRRDGGTGIPRDAAALRSDLPSTAGDIATQVTDGMTKKVAQFNDTPVDAGTPSSYDSEGRRPPTVIGEGGPAEHAEATADGSTPEESNTALRWFNSYMRPEYDPGMLLSLPRSAVSGRSKHECAVYLCGVEDDDYVQTRSCRANGKACAYHRKCLDRQVRGIGDWHVMRVLCCVCGTNISLSESLSAVIAGQATQHAKSMHPFNV